MLPLAGSTIPASAPALAEAMRGGLDEHGLSAHDIAAHGEWPALDTLRVDLTGTSLTRSHRFDSATGPGVGGFEAATFELVASPAHFESAPVQIALRAEGAAFEFGVGAGGGHLMRLQRVARGAVSLEIARTDLGQLVQRLAAEAARPHGVEVKSATVDFTSRGPRAVSVSAEVTAKMFIATATVGLSGDVDLDENLAARVSNLRFTGDGMVANLAGAVIRPHLARLEGAIFPLLDLTGGGITLRDVRLDAGETLRISAEFGA